MTTKPTHGGKRKGSGRKKQPQKVTVTVRMTVDQRDDLKRRAKAFGKSLEGFIRYRIG